MSFRIENAIYIHHGEKSDGNGQSIKQDRIKNFDETTIHMSKMNAIYFMCITGYNSLYLCIMIKHLRRIIN